ncbi:uncharacterized protein FIBRA_01326 [Fibroporia radiculosa]|uniref:Protein FRA10AC1 n=1 Tax=Fibroporia radiculosa TaxID=599839 RepID=J4GJV6_9APHY|nr:uncharacterized protein FIBRA_01326 [Fibroporia radiculosa]CCL99310.1 predicted protein [Fibroporia radiculosa]
MALNPYGDTSRAAAGPSTSEFDILKASHKFLREDDEQESLTWNEQLAKKYYHNLYREFAVCDLKHYKSGNFALRWRTESEVISGAGETTCGNTRCTLHTKQEGEMLLVKTIELPFSYIEDGETKFALVKVVLCDKCLKKLMWRRNKEKERVQEETKAQQAAGKGRAEDTIMGAFSRGEPKEHFTRKRNVDEEPARNSSRTEPAGFTRDASHKRRRKHSQSHPPPHASSHSLLADRLDNR